jgi:hypothetical protein
MPGYHVALIDLDLFCAEAIMMDLWAETFARQKELPANREGSPCLQAAFTGRKVGARRCEGTHVDLAAFTSSQRAQYIEDWLKQHSAAERHT